MSVEEAERILQIPVIWFRYKDGYLAPDDRMNGQKIPGFYAEDIQEIFPEAAQLNEEGEPEDWNYRTLIPAMLKVIQNQEKRITELEKMIKGG